MKTLSQAVNELERLVENFIPRYNIPYTQGKSIRIGKKVVRRSQRHGYVIIDIEDNATVSKAFSKPGAIAIAKAYNENKSYDLYERLDSELEKHFNDSVFYNNIITKTQDNFTKVIMEDRLEISQEHIHNAYSRLEQFILTIQR